MVQDRDVQSAARGSNVSRGKDRKCGGEDLFLVGDQYFQTNLRKKLVYTGKFRKIWRKCSFESILVSL